MFTDDIPLFSKFHDTNKSVNELNTYLEKISQWIYQWRMQFNPDPNNKQMKLSSLANQIQRIFFHPPV